MRAAHGGHDKHEDHEGQDERQGLGGRDGHRPGALCLARHEAGDVADMVDVALRDTHAGLLTPAAVRNQVFGVVRLREGYDLAEVDTFLGMVEITLSALMRDNDELRGRLKEAVRLARKAPPPPSAKAGRVVEIAHEAAERVVGMARQEADAILAQARRQAEELENEVVERVVTLQRQAREAQREALERRIHDLQTFITDFGDRLRDGLNGHADPLDALLDELCGAAERSASPEEGEPPPTSPMAEMAEMAAADVGLAIFDGRRTARAEEM
jgi:DivIVA domain-containing protein